MKQTLLTIGVLSTITLLAPVVRADNFHQCYGEVMTNAFFGTHNAILYVDNHGLPNEVVQSAAFSNCVAIVSNDVMNASADYYMTMTNRLERRVFVTAVAANGVCTYTNFLGQVLGNEATIPRDREMIGDALWAATTRMDDYVSMYYDAPGISNILLNVKSVFLEMGDPKAAESIDEVLAGYWRLDRIATGETGNYE